MTNLQNLQTIANELSANGKNVTIKVLPTRKMRKGEGLSRDQQHGRGAAKGNLGGLDEISGDGRAVGSGFHCRPINSLGRGYNGNKDAVRTNANLQYLNDRKAAAKERLMDKIADALSAW